MKRGYNKVQKPQKIYTFTAQKRTRNLCYTYPHQKFPHINNDKGSTHNLVIIRNMQFLYTDSKENKFKSFKLLLDFF